MNKNIIVLLFLTQILIAKEINEMGTSGVNENLQFSDIQVNEDLVSEDVYGVP